MIGRKYLKVILLGVFLSAMPIVISGQGKPKWLNVFPENSQASLAERLRQLIEYQSGKNWGKHYDLLSSRITQGETKEEYSVRNENWFSKIVPDDQILHFTPNATVKHELSLDSGWWTIYGCAKLKKGNRFVALRASVDAYLEKGEWYFSSIGVITPVDSKPRF